MILFLRLTFAITIISLRAYLTVGQLKGLPPKVEISFPDAADSDFNNGSFAILSNSNPSFEIECSAPYPIEWIFHYSDEDDGTSEAEKRAETHRSVDNFKDKTTYNYIAKIRIEYKGKLLVLVNYTCKATESDDSNLQTHVYMRDQDQKSLLIMEASKEDRGYFRDPIETDMSDCSRAITTVSYDVVDDWTPCFSCETPQGTELELDYEFCRSPIQCNSMHSRQNKKNNCLNVIPWDERRKNETLPPCKRYGEVPLEFNAKLVICKNYGAALSQLYFFGIFKGELANLSSYGPPMFYDWTDIDPLEMLYIHPIDTDVYLGENVTFTCEYSTFYFSLGSWFAIEHNHEINYIKGLDLKPCGFGPRQNHICNQDDVWRGTYSATLNTSFDSIGLHSIYCIGPVWNTSEWVNTSLTFDVKQGEDPEVMSVTPDKNEYFIVGQRNRSIRCNFKGKPKPMVEWSGPLESYFKTEGDTFSEITFSEIGYQTAGIYTCKTSSFLGSHEKSFKLESFPESRKLGTLEIVAIVISCLVVTIIVLAVILRMRKIIAQQKEALRLLTEAEIEEFINGNPELVARGKNEYFNNATAIDALPYDQKYEIPPDKLSIDYSQILGSGEFGLVLKGKVHANNAPQYVNVAMMRETIQEMAAELPDGEELVVAIKICKKDVDVTSFKALLSEIKVMAWLGHHQNIVSLIGASTQNIRNRELYIAVEFCHNGSLESYIRKNKSKFLNKVKYGFYTEDDSEEGEINPSYIPITTGENDYMKSIPSLSDTCVFSSIELFRWTIDIANGVEYIHSKKVIHGDLAIRNVLLSSDLSAKIGDFGLSRQLVETSSYTKKTQCPLPWRNMALESLKNLEFSVKSDMWSLGVTLWELYTLGDIPYPGLSYTQDFVRNIENESLRLAKPSYATNDIYEFMLMCWKNIPDDRPTPTEIKNKCGKLLNNAKATKNRNVNQ